MFIQQCVSVFSRSVYTTQVCLHRRMCFSVVCVITSLSVCVCVCLCVFVFVSGVCECVCFLLPRLNSRLTFFTDCKLLWGAKVVQHTYTHTHTHTHTLTHSHTHTHVISLGLTLAWSGTRF